MHFDFPTTCLMRINYSVFINIKIFMNSKVGRNFIMKISIQTLGTKQMQNTDENLFSAIVNRHLTLGMNHDDTFSNLENFVQ